MNLNVLAVPWRGCQKKKTQQNQFVEKFLYNSTKRLRPIIKPFLESTLFTTNLAKKRSTSK